MVDAQKRKLIWQSRRGMLELDLLLKTFLEKRLSSLSAQEVYAFESLLTHSDPQLYSWLMGHEEPPENELKDIVSLIRNGY